MKIAVASDGPDLDAAVALRFGSAPYLLIIDTEASAFEAIPLPAGSGGATGIGAVAVALEKGAAVLAAGYISPRVAGPLAGHGVRMVSGISGTVRAAIRDLAGETPGGYEGAESGPIPRREQTPEGPWAAAKKTARQFLPMLPMIGAIALLIGLFQAFVSREMLFSLFSGRPFPDTLLGAGFGSILAGNPVNSYVLGDALMRMGVSPYAAAALMVTWVTIGLVQLPAEAASLGGRFALTRNAVAFLVSLGTAWLAVRLVGIHV